MNDEQDVKKGLSAEDSMTIVGAVAGSTAAWNASYDFEPYMGTNTLEMIMFTEIKLLITAAGGIIGGKIGKKLGRKVDKLLN